MTRKKQAAASNGRRPRIDLTPLSRQAQLRDLRLLGSTCAVSLTGAMPPEVTQAITVGSKRHEKERSMVAKLSFSIVAANADGSEGLRIEATFGLMYRLRSLDGVTDDMANGFCRVVGLNDVWPSWREFVQSMTGRMGLPPLRIPLLQSDQLVPTHSQQRDARKPAAKGKHKAQR